jgi:hypothetical protein
MSRFVNMYRRVLQITTTMNVKASISPIQSPLGWDKGGTMKKPSEGLQEGV